MHYIPAKQKKSEPIRKVWDIENRIVNTWERQRITRRMIKERQLLGIRCGKQSIGSVWLEKRIPEGQETKNLCYLHNTFSKEGMQKWTGPRIFIFTQTIKFLLLPSSPIISVKKFHFEWKDQKKKSLFCWVFRHLVNIIALRYVFTVPRPKHENSPIDNLQWGFIIHLLGFPGGSRQWRICLQFRRSGFNSWVGKIP